MSDPPAPTRLLVLCAIDPAPEDPLRRCTGQSRFLGEAGLWLAGQGVELICAAPGATEGYRPVPGAWRPAAVEAVDAVYDRDHGARRVAQRRWEAAGVPVANPPAFHELCDDKLAFARWARGLGLPVPETVPATDDRWRGWDGAYSKPRRGRRGVGVRRLAPGDEPGDGVIQRAVTPAVPGETLRLLLQRSPHGGWRRSGALRRLSPAGADVSGLSTGAAAHPLEPEHVGPLAVLQLRIVEALHAAPQAERVLEVGVDVVIGRDGPAVLEWNARPGRSFHRIGRDDLRRQALRSPFQVLLAWAGRN